MRLTVWLVDRKEADINIVGIALRPWLATVAAGEPCRIRGCPTLRKSWASPPGLESSQVSQRRRDLGHPAMFRCARGCGASLRRTAEGGCPYASRGGLIGLLC